MKNAHVMSQCDWYSVSSYQPISLQVLSHHFSINFSYYYFLYFIISGVRMRTKYKNKILYTSIPHHTTPLPLHFTPHQTTIHTHIGTYICICFRFQQKHKRTYIRCVLTQCMRLSASQPYTSQYILILNYVLQ